jgi:hypothetical protein
MLCLGRVRCDACSLTNSCCGRWWDAKFLSRAVPYGLAIHNSDSHAVVQFLRQRKAPLDLSGVSADGAGLTTEVVVSSR